MLPAACILSLVALFAIAPAVAAQETPPIPADTEVKTTESGIKYSVLAPGNGKVANVGDKVKMHYTGWLTDGTMFDSSRTRGTPFDVKVGVGQVIKGWDEALLMMSVGSRFKVTIPPELAYGSTARGQIPANSTLIFDMEMVELVQLPAFKQPNPAKQKTTESGIKYEALVEGTGSTYGDDKIYDLKYAMFNATGKLLTCTEEGGQPMKGTPGTMPFAFIKEFVKVMQVGGRYRLEVPPELAFGAVNKGPDLPPNSVTVWELELVGVHDPLPLPPFALTAENKGIKTPSGLMYEVIREGAGPVVKKGTKLQVHYAGWHTDGRLFDSSYERADTFTLVVPGRVIRGWNEGLLLMREGSMYRFTLPGDLAYGLNGSPPEIGPNETLVFVIEVVKVGE